MILRTNPPFRTPEYYGEPADHCFSDSLLDHWTIIQSPAFHIGVFPAYDAGLRRTFFYQHRWDACIRSDGPDWPMPGTRWHLRGGEMCSDVDDIVRMPQVAHLNHAFLARLLRHHRDPVSLSELEDSCLKSFPLHRHLMAISATAPCAPRTLLLSLPRQQQ